MRMPGGFVGGLASYVEIRFLSHRRAYTPTRQGKSCGAGPMRTWRALSRTASSSARWIRPRYGSRWRGRQSVRGLFPCLTHRSAHLMTTPWGFDVHPGRPDHMRRLGRRRQGVQPRRDLQRQVGHLHQLPEHHPTLHLPSKWRLVLRGFRRDGTGYCQWGRRLERVRMHMSKPTAAVARLVPGPTVVLMTFPVPPQPGSWGYGFNYNSGGSYEFITRCAVNATSGAWSK